MHIDRIDSPGQTVLRLVVAVIQNAELNALIRLLEHCHHLKDNVFMVVFFEPSEIEIG